MRRLLVWSSVAGFTACLLQPTLATITPDYGYADGCESVIVQGHHLGENATAKLVGAGGSVDFLAFDAWDDEAEPYLDPEGKPVPVPDYAKDAGFKYRGTVAGSPDGAAGWYDVVITVDGEALTINDGWYYRTCPGAIVVDNFDIPADADVGTTLQFWGCNLTDTTEVLFLDNVTKDVTATAPLVSVCSSAEVTAEVPSMPPGVYDVQLSNGTDVYPFLTCIGHSAFPAYAHSGFTGCDPITVTIPAR